MAAKTDRAKRVAQVRAALSRDEFKTTRELSEETGFSPALVGSTLRLIQRVSRNETLTYNPQSKGWKVAESWDDKQPHVRWLRRHLLSRAETLSATLDVCVGLWPDQVPRLLAEAMRFTVSSIDFVGSMVASESETPAVKTPPQHTLFR